MRAAVVAALMLLVLSPRAEAKIPTVEQLLRTGEFAFTAGSSVYRLLKDGTFVLEPAGISGRTIRGAWRKNSAGFFVIVGRWEWLRGIRGVAVVLLLTAPAQRR